MSRHRGLGGLMIRRMFNAYQLEITWLFYRAAGYCCRKVGEITDNPQLQKLGENMVNPRMRTFLTFFVYNTYPIALNMEQFRHNQKWSQKLIEKLHEGII